MLKSDRLKKNLKKSWQLPQVRSDDGVSHNYVELFQSCQRPVQRGAITFLTGGFLDLLLWLGEVPHEPENDPPHCQRGLGGKTTEEEGLRSSKITWTFTK